MHTHRSSPIEQTTYWSVSSIYQKTQTVVSLSTNHIAPFCNLFKTLDRKISCWHLLGGWSMTVCGQTCVCCTHLTRQLLVSHFGGCDLACSSCVLCMKCKMNTTCSHAFYLLRQLILCIPCGQCIQQQALHLLCIIFYICFFIFKGTLCGAHHVVGVMDVNKSCNVTEHVSSVFYVGLKQDALLPLLVILFQILHQDGLKASREWN